ncbi:MAG TPA: M3 family metallopeptidase [Gammaproteobacteria bacterium]|nr:M3 family metallopeptidase [Gammaproteobacteria bacterium]
MTRISETLEQLKERYLELHTRKEDLFWITKMGTADDMPAARKSMAEAEIAWNRFLQDPARLAALCELEAGNEGTEQEARILRGWVAMLAAHVIERRDARKLSEEVVELESELAEKRGGMQLGFVDPETGMLVSASSVRLALMIRSDPDEARRKAAYEGLRSIEGFVLDGGFLDIVKKRNRLGRMLGYEDYYAWRVAVVERMTKSSLFGRLDALAARTAAKSRAELAAFEKAQGAGSLEPWNFGFLRSGQLTRELDPYFGFAVALERWGRSFHALGVRYRGATLTLDLVDRAGKYENGFMHGPGLAFYDGGRWRAARVNFTANAVVGQPGSGLRATETLFHEGGHAAHFSNILCDAPCFSQEFAPTSVAYAETQSMFMDSMLGDADWRARYARDAQGRPMPLELIETALRERQPFRCWDIRAMLTIPMAERALYELPEEDLRPDRVLESFRRIERELQGLTAGIRPVLAVPHLLAGESSAYYHGYLLAEMAVEQTRRFFLKRDGHLVDNSAIGPDLARHYWAPGNAASFDETLESLTGRPLAPDALVDACNLGTDEAIAAAREAVKRIASLRAPAEPIELDATIRVVHGREIVATTESGSFEQASADFHRFIECLEAGSAGAAS